MTSVRSCIDVLIVDDHEVTRAGLRWVIQAYPDLRLVGDAGSAEEALKLCTYVRPHVVLMHLLPGTDGAAATAAIKQSHPDVQVIALTAARDPEAVAEAVRAGAIGFVPKVPSARELVSLIRTAHQDAFMQ
jgi:DNA-binding NarL/FixJ family response regulator